MKKMKAPPPKINQSNRFDFLCGITDSSLWFRYSVSGFLRRCSCSPRRSPIEALPESAEAR